MHLCPVCGFDHLAEPPVNFTICPSCGTEFGYDDAFALHAELRAAWLNGGARWWSPVDPRPEGWNGQLQVRNVTLPILRAFRGAVPSAAIQIDLEGLRVRGGQFSTNSQQRAPATQICASLDQPQALVPMLGEIITQARGLQAA